MCISNVYMNVMLALLYILCGHGWRLRLIKQYISYKPVCVLAMSVNEGVVHACHLTMTHTIIMSPSTNKKTFVFERNNKLYK